MAALGTLITGTPLEWPARWVAHRFLGVGNPEWLRRGRRDEAAMAEIIRTTLSADDSAVDVGANKGEILDWITAAAPNGQHHAVEPLPVLAENLRRKFPQVTVHECAVADSEGAATFFHVVGQHGWSGLRKQHVAGSTETEEIPVRLARLADLLGPAPVRLIKIDVEGAELGAIRGAAPVLDAHRPVLILEHAIIHAELFDVTPGQVWDLLNGHGYGVAPVADRSNDLDRTAFVRVCESSHRSSYDRNATTNWVAQPR